MNPPLPPPDPALRVCVVVPAHDEADEIMDCIGALAAQEGVAAASYEVLLVLDACTDATAERAREAADAAPGLRLHLLDSPTRGPGATRRHGMEEACRRLLLVGRRDGLIASTDADSTPRRDWLARQLDLVARGAQAVGGLIEVRPEGLPEPVMARRRERLRDRLVDVRRDAADHAAEHPFFGGASLALTVDAYRRAGGLPPLAALEDQALGRALEERGIPITRSGAVRVATSGRTRGRARHGLAADLRADAWTRERTFRASLLDPADLASRKRGTVSLVLPCREVAETIGPVLDAVGTLERVGLVGEVVVVDAASADGTADVASARGARVVQESDLMPGFGPCRGKGDAMWRALAATSGEIVAYVDTDTRDFTPAFVAGLLAPLIADPRIAFVKGAFRRHLDAGGRVRPDEGGRVTELVARPLLGLVAPELGCFAQPLAGEAAGRRALLESLSMPVGYGVEIAMLIDVWRAVGLDAMAQVHLGTRQNRHQPLRDLGTMALEVMCAGLGRGLPAEAFAALAPGRMLVPDADGGVGSRDARLEERPPMAGVRRVGPSAGRS